MLRTLNFLTTSAAKSFRSMPGSLGSRSRLPGALMCARNGYEATATRSHGAVGKSMCGLGSAEAAWLIPAKTLPAARAEAFATNLRRVIRLMGDGDYR